MAVTVVHAHIKHGQNFYIITRYKIAKSLGLRLLKALKFTQFFSILISERRDIPNMVIQCTQLWLIKQFVKGSQSEKWA